ncbi:MAG: hypothetical protein ACRD3A_14960 [Terriglobales bacterium]
MRHPRLGRRVFLAAESEQAVTEGWFPDMSERTNFLEAVHIQAYYFQARWFPRFRWFKLHAPDGEYFVMGDRAVGWAADGYTDAPPSCLRDPSAYVLAPISRNLVLVGRYSVKRWNVTAGRINALIARFADEWIVGPKQATVQSALENRRLCLNESLLQ